MFTGLIEEIGAVARRSGQEMSILAETVLEDLCEGDSVAVDGACLTAVAVNEEDFVVQVSPETLNRTTLAELKPGDAVNLERAMSAGGRFGGHFVQGHVDGVGQVTKVENQGEFALWEFQAPNEVARYLTPKGSIAVDGISLTVVEPVRDTFSVAIIPATLEKTTLKAKRPGHPVNLEADMISKQIYQFLKNSMGGGGLTMETLKKQGFA
ncbi:MAG: riboflavin synthase [Candidatus Hydrogenedentota bacterium]